MSLIAWYPLNGDTNDYSGNGFHATNGNASISNSGKIGKCYTFNATSINAGNNDNLNNVFRGRNFSVTAWIKFTDTSGSDRGIINIGSAGTDTLLHIVRRGTVLYMGFYADDMQSSTTISNDVWYNVIFTWNSYTKVRNIYINGILDVSGVSTGILNVTAGSSLLIGSAHVGDLNDVRIYDHTLSVKEIKEIAKAKILHYTFNDFQEPTTNILYTDIDTTFETYSDNDTVGFNSQLGTGGYVGVSSTKGYKSSKSLRINRGVGGTRVYRTKAILLGDEITFSSWIYSIVSGPFIYIEYFGGDYTWQNTTSNIHTGSGWELLYLTRPIATSNTTCYYFIYPGNDNSDIYVDNIQIEKKNHLTEYTEISRTGKIRDISGFRNDCTLTEATTPQWTSDTKLGSGSYKFNGTTSYLTQTSIGTFNFNDGVSFACWVYPTTNGNWERFMDFSNGSANNNLLFGRSGTSSDITLHSYNVGTSSSIYVTSVITNNTWQHFAFTISNTGNAKVYKNGLEVGSGTLNVPNVVTRTLNYIGKSAWPDALYTGKMDDIRMYVTELSPANMLELYKTRAQLDNKGNLFLNELVMLPKSAFDIKMRYPNASSGIYTVYPTGNENVPVSIYCDMETEGGPWTLLVTTTTNSWTTTTVLDKNSTSPSITSDYSILKYANLFKTNLNGKLNYRMDATTFGRWGGIWEAPYTNTLLAKSALSQSLSTNIVKWDSWNIDTTLDDTASPTNQIPWLGPDPQLLTTYGGAGSWWGTLVSTAFSPAPWMSSENPNPGIIWYWVK